MLTRVLRAAVVALCAGSVLAVPALEIKGADFVNPNTGDRFQIVGVAYQPGGSSAYSNTSGVDPLSDGSVCLRDAALMQRLGVNAIRVYNVNPDLNHDLCASIFNEVGIYMLVDVNSPLPNESIDQNAPWTSYDATYLNRTFAVVEGFKNYQNTLLFFAGNEVINDDATGVTVPPYMRAVTRDLKNYIAKNSQRQIPVGYSAADVRDILFDTWNYLQCSMTGDDSDPSRVDLFALNSYSWCGDSTFQEAQYDVLVGNFSSSSVPVFFSEYGCNTPAPRVFTEVPVIYGPLMTPALSGGLVYEFANEVSKFGLCQISPNGSAQLLPDYDTLQAQLNTLNVQTVQGQTAQNTTIRPPKCSASLINATSTFNKNFTLPAEPPGVTDLIQNGIDHAPVGRIIPVSDTRVAQLVQATNGQPIQGLAIVPVANNVFNNPGNYSTTSASSSPTSSSSTSTSKPSTTSSSPAATSSKSSAVAIRLPLGGIFVAALSALALF